MQSRFFSPVYGIKLIHKYMQESDVMSQVLIYA